MGMVPPRILTCIFAHPDDEAFGPGGAIAHYAQICPVHLLCVTDGDSFGNGDLKTVRRSEMQASAKILGVSSLEFLGFNDGSLCNNNYHEVAGQIQAKLDILLPDTVMTFDPNGVSGHIDHMAVAMITSFLFEKLDYLKTLMYFCGASDIKQIMQDYFVYVPPGLSVSEVDLQLDVSSVLETKISAMRQHVSQQSDCDWILDKMGHELHQELFRIARKPL